MRPNLDSSLNPEQFKDFYWLKEELTAFCKQYGLPKSGSKQELAERIYHYLKFGEILKVTTRGVTRQPAGSGQITLDAKIPENYRSDEAHRTFFKNTIGSHFKFNVIFMNWMKANAGKSYQNAVDEWRRIDAEKKAGKKFPISNQFEYNQYTRDFFADNPTMSRQEAIACWKFKKSLPGSNKYEKSDLQILTA